MNKLFRRNMEIVAEPIQLRVKPFLTNVPAATFNLIGRLRPSCTCGIFCRHTEWSP